MAFVLKKFSFVWAFVLFFALSGCTASNVSQDVSNSSNLRQSGTGTNADPISQAALAPETDPSRAATATNQQAPTFAGTSVTFLPIQGAPQSAVTSLSKALNSSAASDELAVVPPNQTGADFSVKGYFSALNDGGGTLLIYIWDITDRTGKRVHRINGQERTSKSRTNPWDAITEDEIERIAETTTSSLKSWIETRG